MRAWVIAAALAILPLLVYWPTVSHEYGFRDDYAHLREVRERPGWLTELTTSNGRPVYGAVLEASLRDIDIVAELEALRLTSTVLLAVVGLLLWWHLRRSGWSEAQAAALGAAVTLLPGAQVVVGWAIAWPIALGLVMAVAGFAFVDRGLGKQGLAARLEIAAGVALYILAGLTYQTSALFAVMLIGAVLLVRDSASTRADAKWAGTHLCALFGSLVAGFAAMNLVFTEGVVPEAARMALEPEPLTKLVWFIRNPLPNSIALFALRDRFNTPPWFWLVVAAVLVVALVGFALTAKNAQRRARWLVVALLLPFAAHSVSLAASSQAIGYRTLLPLSGVFLALLVFGVRTLVERYRVPRAAEAVLLGAFVLVGAVLARHNTFTLIAEPQGYEWQLVKAAADSVKLDGDTRVYLIRPSIVYRATRRMYADEYGSLTSDADWAAKEMFKAAMRQRFPNGLPTGTSYSLLTAFAPPPQQYHYDFVADLRRLVNLGERAAIMAETTASQR